jgi:FAD synthase
MNTTKNHFIERANEIGVLFVRRRNFEEDLTGWGALEFILNNGEIFVVSGEQFGQGSGEDGLWVDMNKVSAVTLNKIKQQESRIRNKQKTDTISAWLKHQTV